MRGDRQLEKQKTSKSTMATAVLTRLLPTDKLHYDRQHIPDHGPENSLLCTTVQIVFPVKLSGPFAGSLFPR